MTTRPVSLSTAVSINLQYRFAAPRGSVFRAWTDPEILGRWWCPPGWSPAEIEVDLRTGGEYRIGMSNPSDSPPVYVHGQFLEVACPERLVYTWRWKNAFEDMPETQVTVLFMDAPGGGTDLHLAHVNLPGIPICLRHWNGWKEAWPRIDAVLAGVPDMALEAAD